MALVRDAQKGRAAPTPNEDLIPRNGMRVPVRGRHETFPYGHPQ